MQKAPIVKYFDESPDGERTEMGNDPEVESFMKTLDSDIEQLDDGGDAELRSFIHDPDKDPGELPQVPEDDGLAESIHAKLKALNTELEMLKSRMAAAPEGSATPTISAEDRARLREAVLDLGMNG